MAQPARKQTMKAAATEAVRPKMEALARFVLHMSDEEIWAFLDALLPEMSADDKEDLWGSILIYKRKDEPRRPFAEVMKELEREQV